MPSILLKALQPGHIYLLTWAMPKHKGAVSIARGDGGYIFTVG